MWEPFTERAKAAIVAAKNESIERGSAAIDTLDFLVGFLEDKECAAYEYLAERGVTKHKIEEASRRSFRWLPPSGDGNHCQEMAFTESAKSSISKSFEVARSFGFKCIGTECLLVGILDLNRETLAHKALKALGVCPKVLSKRIRGDSIKAEMPTSAAAATTSHPWLKLSPFGVRP